MASGGLEGEIFIWDLKEKQLFLMKQDAHRARVVSDGMDVTNSYVSLHQVSLFFFPGSSILISSSEDNSLKQWTLDLSSKELSIVRQRVGPRSSPFYLSFYDVALLRWGKQYGDNGFLDF